MMQLTVRGRLLAFAFVALGLMVGLAVAAGYYYRKIRATGAFETAVQETMATVQNARIAEKAYLQFYQREYRQRHADCCRNAGEQIDVLRSMAFDLGLEQQGGDEGEAEGAGGGVAQNRLALLAERLTAYDDCFESLANVHGRSAALSARMMPANQRVMGEMSDIFSELAAQEFQLQMEGEGLTPDQTGLQSASLDALILVLRMENAHQGFLVTGDEKRLVDFGEYRKTRETSVFNAVDMFSKAVGEKKHIDRVQDYLKTVKAHIGLLGEARDLFHEETERAQELDGLGNELSVLSDGIVAEAENAATEKESVGVVMILGLLAGGAILFMGVSTRIIRSITRRVARATHFAEDIGAGDITTRLRMEGRDEIARLGSALDTMADGLAEKVALAEAISRGDLTREVRLASERDTLGHALQSMRAELNTLIERIRGGAVQMDSGASQVAGASQSLSSGATEQAASLEEISSSMTQMGTQTRGNAESAKQASSLAGSAREVAGRGNEQMQSMMAAMREIEAESNEISGIIKVIDDIAFQTNLLALNAAVEAARAGRHGKGFAVVAQEVRNLAVRSAKAARNTSERIEASLEKIRLGHDTANQTGEVLGEIVQRVAEVNDLIQEISVASSEQAQGISQVTSGLSQVDDVTQQNTANAEETASAAEELAGQAGQLRELVGQFRIAGDDADDTPAAGDSAGQHAEADSPAQPQAESRLPDSAGRSASSGDVAQRVFRDHVVRPDEAIQLDDKEFAKY